MTGSSHGRRGFTLVEMLVVIGVIALLAGILLPALAGVRRRALKSEETNHLRQVGIAWNLYANGNDDAALPGFLPPEVQEAWKVQYKFLDKSEIDYEISAAWVWRLMPHLSFNHDAVHGYVDETDSSDLATIEEAQEIADEPQFGYNALYVGGWWELPDGAARPRALLSDAYVSSPNKPVNAIVRSPSQIRDTTRLVLFCPSTLADEGIYDHFERYRPGAHWVTAPAVADQAFWRRYGDEVTDDPAAGAGIAVTAECTIPLGRYTGQAVALHADLHLDSYVPDVLADQRYWINIADDRRFRHSTQSAFAAPW